MGDMLANVLKPFILFLKSIHTLYFTFYLFVCLSFGFDMVHGFVSVYIALSTDDAASLLRALHLPSKSTL